jgi:hypothetical protein
MENELNQEGLEFEDFLDELEEFEDEFEIEVEEIETRTAILTKNNMIAMLCLKTANQGGAICRIDPREDRPSVQLYDDPEKALEWYAKSLRTSRQNGWTIAYDGLPLRG